MIGDFHGLPTYITENEHIQVECLSQAGPRIVRLHLAGVEGNQLVEIPDIHWPTPHGPFKPYGGHRLWVAPEANPRTYAIDDEGLEVEPLADGVLLRGPGDPHSGIRKSVAIHLQADRPALTLHHRLQNDGLWPVELAPWAITQLPLGGIAVLPQQVGPLNRDRLLPNRQLVLWPYTNWDDPRLHLHNDYLLVSGQAHLPPFKIGYMNRQDWQGYLRQGVFFCKRIQPQPERPHPDYGCNTEVYCNDRFIEVETVAPLSRLDPGGEVTHTETWEWYVGLDAPPTVEGIRALVENLAL
jgi:hypothetical protein